MYIFHMSTFSPKPLMPKMKPFSGIVVLLLFSSGCNALATPTVAPTATANVEVIPTLTPAKIPLTEAEVPRVTLEDAKTAFDNGRAVFVDVRSKDAYKAGHIPDALLIQLGEFETNPTKLKLPKDQWIITYCT